VREWCRLTSPTYSARSASTSPRGPRMVSFGFIPANGGWRHHIEAARFVGLGVKPGVADLILLHSGRFHALELKAHAKSKVSKAQKQFIADVRAAGGHGEIAYGLDHALRVLEGWQLLRGPPFSRGGG